MCVIFSASGVICQNGLNQKALANHEKTEKPVHHRLWRPWINNRVGSAHPAEITGTGDRDQMKSVTGYTLE